MEFIAKVDCFNLYRYKPSLLFLFGKPYPEKKTLRRVIRFMLALKYGYEIYYCMDHEKTVAYCVVESGKATRYTFTHANDIIVGPYYVVEDYRGNNIASKVVSTILEAKKECFGHAFEYIKRSNIGSIKSSEKAGFIRYGNAKLSKLFRDVRLCEDESSEYILMIR